MKPQAAAGENVQTIATAIRRRLAQAGMSPDAGFGGADGCFVPA
jgi:hypothetical protein